MVGKEVWEKFAEFRRVTDGGAGVWVVCFCAKTQPSFFLFFFFHRGVSRLKPFLVIRFRQEVAKFRAPRYQQIPIISHIGMIQGLRTSTWVEKIATS